MKSFFVLKIKVVFTFFISAFLLASCKKLVEVPSPTTSITADNVYSTDATAAAVMNGLYSRLNSSEASFSSLPGLFFYAGLSSDELTLYNTSNTGYMFYYQNNLPNEPANDFWSRIYLLIYHANSALEGIDKSNSLTPAVKQQLLGEAKFIRALCYFYLVNLYGDVCIVTGTDWKVNSLVPRSNKEQAWQLIISDLKDAQDLLNANYVEADLITSKTSTERIRPTKWAATALLARVYLYTRDWANSEASASTVISNASYDLISLNDVFKRNSKETIWQLQANNSTGVRNTGQGYLFVLETGPNITNRPVYLSSDLVNSFEAGDQRKKDWVAKFSTTSVPVIDYYYSYKYKIATLNSTPQEYPTVLRLAEQYLIRAEARAQQGKSNAADDLNKIRNRAGLANYTGPSDKASLLTTILHERQVELFTEWGHRWLDLKRTNAIDTVMNIVCQKKGGTWNTNWQWYPIPLSELVANPALIQNDGYNH